jgi:hypothetical protein
MKAAKTDKAIDREKGLERLRTIALESEKSHCIAIGGYEPEGDTKDFDAWCNQYEPDDLIPMDRPEGEPDYAFNPGGEGEPLSYFFLLDDGTIVEWYPAIGGDPAHRGAMYPPDCGMPPKVKNYHVPPAPPEDRDKPIDVRLRELLSECSMLTEADIDVFEHLLVTSCMASVVNELMPDTPEEEHRAEVIKLAGMSRAQYEEEMKRD